MKLLLIIAVIMTAAKIASCATASGIVRYARRQIGSTKWSFAGSHETGSNTNKCNIFVADVLKHENADAPNRYPIIYKPIGALEWANSGSSYLSSARCWSLCSGSPSNGDVIAQDGHVGIVTGNRKTTSATYDTVVENDWGFRSGQNPTCWRYQYSKWFC